MLKKTAKTKYVVGFAFGNKEEGVVLIKKNRPDWQAGKLNGVGGHMEKGETYYEAMEREFEEETGLNIPIKEWHHFVTLSGHDFEIRFMRTFGVDLGAVRTVTDEDIVVVNVSDLHKLNVIENLKWLIPLAADPDISEPIKIKYGEPYSEQADLNLRK